MNPHPPIEARASRWLQRHVHLLKPGARVLDVACGSGRHMHWLAERGFAVTGIDRDAQALAACAGAGRAVQADIESGPWPLPGQTFDAVLVTNYLWRPLLPVLMRSVGPQGLLIYETFAHGHQSVGRPSRADFLLQPGELISACAGLRVVAFEDGFESAQPRYVQRIVAVRENPGTEPPPRHELRPPGAGG